MAQGAASSFRRIFTAPGNPQLPVLPNPSDPKEGLSDNFGTGASVVELRIPQTILPVAGASPGVSRGFAQFYLDGVGAIPSPINFGNITGAKQRTVTLHNTNRFAVDVTALDLTAVSGVSLISPGLPISIPPFSSQAFIVEAAVAGAASFDALAVFTTSTGTINVRMTGRRVIIFDTIPEKIAEEQLRFLTDIMISDNGLEQAMSARHAPRSRLRFNIRHTDDQERTRLTNLQLGAQHLPTGVQLWWQSRELTSPALATDLVLQCVTADMEIENAGTLSLVFLDGSNFEVEVVTFDANSITLTEAVGVALPESVSVMPIKFGVQSDTVDLADFAVGAEDMRVTFDLFDYANIGEIDPAYFELHPVDGLPIPITPMYFSGASRKGDIKSNQSRLDSQTGTLSQSRNEALSRPGQEILVFCDSQADQHAWRKFLHFVRGSWGRFYVPTGTNDLPLFSYLTLGGNTFDVPNMGVANLIGNIAPRRDVRVTVADVDYYRRVTSTVDNGVFETITLSDIIPGVGNVAPADVYVSWLTHSRIVGDVATFTHNRRNQADLRFNIRGVIDGV